MYIKSRMAKTSYVDLTVAKNPDYKLQNSSKCYLNIYFLT